MGISDFAIITDHPFNKYKPGETIRGKVHFKLSEPKRVRGVYIKLKGKATVEWSEIIQLNKIRTSVRYFAEHEYFHRRIYFAGSNGGDMFELPAKEYNYKFKYTLPNGLPSTFRGSYGRIEYKLKAVLDIPLAFDDEVEMILDITSPIDLNSMPYLKRSDHCCTQKRLCCLCCILGPILMEVYLPKTGFAYGEEIPIKIDVENRTSGEILKIVCKLKQKIIYHSKYPRFHFKHDESTLSHKILRGVAKRSTQTYKEVLAVPLGPVLNFTNCNYMKVEYKVKVSACFPGMHKDLDVEIPLILGGIPIPVNRENGSNT